jgi:hypothetical protein
LLSVGCHLQLHYLPQLGVQLGRGLVDYCREGRELRRDMVVNVREMDVNVRNLRTKCAKFPGNLVIDVRELCTGGVKLIGDRIVNAIQVIEDRDRIAEGCVDAGGIDIGVLFEAIGQNTLRNRASDCNDRHRDIADTCRYDTHYWYGLQGATANRCSGYGTVESGHDLDQVRFDR